MRDVAAYPIVCMPRGTGLRTVFDHACAEQDLGPTIALQASAAPAIAGLATRGLAVGILTDSMVAPYRDRLVARVIEDLDARASLALLWPHDPSPTLRELLVHCRRSFAVRPFGAAVEEFGQ